MSNVTVTVETTLMVEDFLGEGGDHETAFDDAANAEDKAVSVAVQDAAEALGPDEAAKLTFSNPEFVEFDSSNPTHAGAHYSVAVEGPEEVVAEYLRVCHDTTIEEIMSGGEPGI